MPKQKVLDPGKYLNAFLKEGLEIHPMKLRDLDQVLEIERLSFASPWSRGQFLDEIQRNPISFPFVLLFSPPFLREGVGEGPHATANLPLPPSLERRGKSVAGFCVSWILR